MEPTVDLLKTIDWDFADYNSSLFPTDVNSLHWYPAAFVPQIPAMLMNALSRPHDLVLDPFAGSGVTLIEAARLRRRILGIDSNPFAVDIMRAKVDSLSYLQESWFDRELRIIESLVPTIDSLGSFETRGIDPEVARWFEEKTLAELLSIFGHIADHMPERETILRKVIFSSILNRCSSQRDHYTYITDRCFPKDMIFKPAKQIYLQQLSLVRIAVSNFRDQFRRMHGTEWSNEGTTITHGDARDLSSISDTEVDLVVTSPPYLGVNDYVRSMLLTHLFFPSDAYGTAVALEIGARRKRRRQQAFQEYISDMVNTFREIARVLKPKSFLCLVLGQGKGKVNKENDVVKALLAPLNDELKFKLEFQADRKIRFRRIQVRGVGTEKIMVFRR